MTSENRVSRRDQIGQTTSSKRESELAHLALLAAKRHNSTAQGNALEICEAEDFAALKGNAVKPGLQGSDEIEGRSVWG